MCGRSGSFRAFLSRAARAAPARAQRRASRVTVRVAMPMRRQQPDDAVQAAELAALADGSLAPERRAELDARIAASPELAESAGRAAASSRARAERRYRGRGAGSSPSAHRARSCASPAGAMAPRRRRVGGGGRRGPRRRPGGAFHRDAGPAIPRSSRAYRPRARRRRSRDDDQDILGLADRARMPRGYPAARAACSTRPGCAIAPACWCRSEPSMRAGRSRCGRACHRRTIRA